MLPRTAILSSGPYIQLVPGEGTEDEKEEIPVNGEEKNNKATELNEKNLEEVSGGTIIGAFSDRITSR